MTNRSILPLIIILNYLVSLFGHPSLALAVLPSKFSLAGLYANPGRRIGPFPALFRNHSSKIESKPAHGSRNSPSDTSAPSPYRAPVWPPRFQVDFKEDNFFFFYTLSTTGTYTYDFPSNRMRLDRDNGRGDRYCGSAMPGYNSPCTHLVVEGERYLIFPKESYCCKCCTAEQGCGVLRPDWLANATYLGHDYIYGTLTTKWNMPGLQNNYYWQTLDEIPVRLYQEPLTQMTFTATTYAKPASFSDALFSLPTDLDCSPQCYGLCSVL